MSMSKKWKLIAEDPDAQWFNDNVVVGLEFARRFTKLEMRDASLRRETLLIPCCKRSAREMSNFILLKADFTASTKLGTQQLFTLQEAVEIEKRLYEKFGLGLLAPYEWAYVYAYASSDGCTGAEIAENLRLKFSEHDGLVEKQTAYWTDRRVKYTQENCGLKFGVAFTIHRNHRGFSLTTRKATDKLRLRFGVADKDRYEAALVDFGAYDGSDDNSRDWI